MVSRPRWLGLAVGLLSVACSDARSTPGTGSASAPLVGGQPDTATRGIVGLVIDQMSGCSGSLIAPNLVLTARHCVASLNSSDGSVQCGVTTFGAEYPPSAFVATWDDNLRNGIPSNTAFSVSDVRTTPGNGVCGNDVALLILSQNIPSNVAALITPRLDAPPQGNEVFDAVGYGITDPDDVNGATFGQRLRVNGLHVLCVGQSCSTLGGASTEWGAYTPVCGGDSGGPALDSSGRVMGVASRGDENCDAALYGTVSSWKSLIIQTAIDAANAGGYTPPTWAGGTPVDAGVPADAGTPNDAGTAADAGTPVDSGTPNDAGAPDTGSPEPEDSGTPAPDPGGLGEPCSGDCATGLSCYIPNQGESGTCVPPCSSTGETCPLGYQCSERLALCLPSRVDPDDDGDSPDSETTVSCGCRTAGQPAGAAGAWALSLLALVFCARRRRQE